MPESPQHLNTKDSTSLLTKVGEYLAAQGVGTLGTDIFLQVLPEEPVTGTAVVHTGGINLPGDPTRRPSLQVLHRNVSAEAGLDKSVIIHRLLDDQWNVLTGFPGRLVAASEPGSYFKDEAGLFSYSMNFVLVSTHQR